MVSVSIIYFKFLYRNILSNSNFWTPIIISPTSINHLLSCLIFLCICLFCTGKHFCTFWRLLRSLYRFERTYLLYWKGTFVPSKVAIFYRIKRLCAIFIMLIHFTYRRSLLRPLFFSFLQNLSARLHKTTLHLRFAKFIFLISLNQIDIVKSLIISILRLRYLIPLINCIGSLTQLKVTQSRF